MTNNLNSGYYGPSIPSRTNYNRPSRSIPGTGCCCSCIECCGCCIINLVFKLILTILVVLGLLALILWFIFRPHDLKFHVEQSRITQFQLLNTTLSYNLTTQFSIRNPNDRVSLYYDSIEARPLYRDVPFGSIFLPNFYQPRNNATTLPATFQGHSVVDLKGKELSDYKSDSETGVFPIQIKLYFKLRLKIFLGIKLPQWKRSVKCDIEVPGDGNSTVVFQRTQCGFNL